MTKTPDPTTAVIGNMRALRKARKWSCMDLSNRLGEAGFPISRSVLANQESGRIQTLNVGFLFALAHVFGVEPWVLTATRPPCTTCGGMPPGGYSCLACGKGNPR